MVSIEDVGNPADTTDYGAVGYAYRIGKYDVTQGQYAAFLNAVAATDTYNLYNTRMATDLNVAGISRSGASGSYTYAAIGSGNRPVSYLSWFDTARFANWMQNGQPTGPQTAATTEQGAYTLNGLTRDGLAISKNADAQYWIPDENEWYKAAYYDASLNLGAGGYWQYPTRSNTAPGNTVGTSPNQANIWKTVFSVTQSATYSNAQNYLTDVGSYSGSASYYGTFDQGGEVLQWNDTVIGSGRGLRGGSWPGSASFLLSSNRPNVDPSFEREDYGFRLAAMTRPPIATTEVVSPQVTISGANVNITVKSSVPGRGYQLQTCSDLGGHWQEVGSMQMGTGNDLVISAARDPLAPRGFYRLLLY
jgi:formylglycine-generating enzyme required for sulfatase activity